MWMNQMTACSGMFTNSPTAIERSRRCTGRALRDSSRWNRATTSFPSTTPDDTADALGYTCQSQ